jgi:hypothetical protein
VYNKTKKNRNTDWRMVEGNGIRLGENVWFFGQNVKLWNEEVTYKTSTTTIHVISTSGLQFGVSILI